MKLVQTAVALTALTWLTVTPVLAFQPGGVQIKGNIEQSVSANTMLNVAAGVGSKAGQSIATIHSGTEISGNVKQSVNAKTILNVAAGVKSMACQEIATIGDNPACK